jgi:heme exporter protein B
VAERAASSRSTVGTVLADARLVAAKDLRLEVRSRVGLGQVLPFALLVVLLFAFALDPDRRVLGAATPGLFWMVVLFAAVMAVGRSFGVEADDDVLDGLRLSGLSPAGIYFGKVLALFVELLLLGLLLAVAVVVFYGTEVHGPVLLVAVLVTATLGIAASGGAYGALVARIRGRDTLLPLVMLPMLAPVLISATRGVEVALERDAGPGWPWVGLLGIFALVYLTLGALMFRSLLEDA